MTHVSDTQTSLPFIDLPPSPDPDFVLRIVKVPVAPSPALGSMSRLDRHFWLFHSENPDVYVQLVQLCRDLKARGRSKVGMKMLFEVLRWSRMLRTEDPASDFKLNNNLTSRYARLLMTNEPDLTGMFDVRELRS
jgi:hypothetical protein